MKSIDCKAAGRAAAQAQPSTNMTGMSIIHEWSPSTLKELTRAFPEEIALHIHEYYFDYFKDPW